MESGEVLLAVINFLKASLKNHLRLVAKATIICGLCWAVGHWWSPLMCLCVPSFYSHGFVLEHLTFVAVVWLL
jgi:hypothetical protein